MPACPTGEETGWAGFIFGTVAVADVTGCAGCVGCGPPEGGAGDRAAATDATGAALGVGVVGALGAGDGAGDGAAVGAVVWFLLIGRIS